MKTPKLIPFEETATNLIKVKIYLKETKPKVRSTYEPKEKLTINEWFKHIHTEVKKQYQEKPVNNSTKFKIVHK
jgi:hypothetical protein